MGNLPSQWSSTIAAKARYLFFDLLGVAGLMLKRHYAGPYQEAVWSYGGNVAASFAMYFIVALLPLPPRFSKPLAGGLALLAVELFEATNGFGVMTNTYDPVDFAANAAGVALALAVDIVTSRISRRPRHHPGGLGSGLRLT